MGYKTHILKIPDDEPWIALVEVTPDGESEIVGYINTSDFDQLAVSSGKLFYLWNAWNRR